MKKGFGIVLIMVILFGLIGSTASAKPATPRAQIQLAQMAAEQPDALVQVIVQQVAGATGAEAQVAKLGGKVTKDLHIIHAFAAEMSAEAAMELARSESVRWVSLDNEVRQAVTSSGQYTTWAAALGDFASSSIVSNFNGTPINAGRTIWLSTILSKVSGLSASKVTKITFYGQKATFSANGADYNLPVADSQVIFDPAVTSASTTFDPVQNLWVTKVFPSFSGKIFQSGLAFNLPAGLPGGINPVTWSGYYVSDAPGITVSWDWQAAVYTQFNKDYNALGIKPVDGSKSNPYANSDQAGTPEGYKSFVTGGARGGGGSNYTGGLTGTGTSLAPAPVMTNAANIIDSVTGPNGTFGFGSNLQEAFGGFVSERNPGFVISKVEAVFKAYVPVALSSTDVMKLSLSLGGVAGTKNVSVPASTFSNYVGAAKAGTIYVDITSLRGWNWSDFDAANQIRLIIDQLAFNAGHSVYYDAVGLRVSSSAGNDSTGAFSSSSYFGPQDTSRLSNVYNQVVHATDVWNSGPAYLQGQNMNVAVVDSGVYYVKDLYGNVPDSVNFNPAYHSSTDKYGHGTFVSGIVVGDGASSGGAYMGIAPQGNVINVRVSDDQGMSTESDVVSALQWIYDHKTTDSIKVVNLSLNSSVAVPYNTSPLDAAAEILWFNGITVVASAGNNGTATLYPPANDPFVITVGATDDKGTVSTADDVVTTFSAYGLDSNGGIKPDLVAPGRNIIAPLPANSTLTIAVQHPEAKVNTNYFRLSGTSMSAPMVSGAVLLLLQDEPNLTPDQVKYRLMTTANKNWAGYNATTAGAGYLDVYAAVNGTSVESANTNILPSQLLSTGTDPITFGSVGWNSVGWNSVGWNSVGWNSVGWNSVGWNSDYWGK